jgi:hypothetical protein
MSEYTYERTWEQIHDMLDRAERKKNHHATQVANKNQSSKQRMFHARNYKALEGVCKTLRWTLGDPKVDTPLE